MKQHKAKGVWRHRPDELPLEDGSSMGVVRNKRKKRPKQLHDIAKQSIKELQREAKYFRLGIRWEFTLFSYKQISKICDKMDSCLKQLLGGK